MKIALGNSLLFMVCLYSASSLMCPEGVIEATQQQMLKVKGGGGGSCNTVIIYEGCGQNFECFVDEQADCNALCYTCDGSGTNEYSFPVLPASGNTAWVEDPNSSELEEGGCGKFSATTPACAWTNGSCSCPTQAYGSVDCDLEYQFEVNWHCY